jgi:hypothetical protein
MDIKVFFCLFYETLSEILNSFLNLIKCKNIMSEANVKIHPDWYINTQRYV